VVSTPRSLNEPHAVGIDNHARNGDLTTHRRLVGKHIRIGPDDARSVHPWGPRESDVPLLYLAAQNPSDRADEADDPIRQARVESWSPGTWRVVSAPHWMDEADVSLVAEAVREVIGLAR